MKTLILLAVWSMAGVNGAPAPPGADSCAYLVAPSGQRIALQQALGEPVRLLAAVPCPDDPRTVVVLAAPRPAASPPERIVALVKDGRAATQHRLRLEADEVAPFVACVPGGFVLVRPSLGRILGWDLQGRPRFQVQLPGTEHLFDDEPTVLVASGRDAWFVAWARQGETRWASYTPEGTLQEQGRVPGWPAHLVVFQDRPLLVRYFVEQARIQRFEVVDLQSGQVWYQSPRHLNLWPLGPNRLLLQEGARWHLWEPQKDPVPLPLRGKLRVFRHPEDMLLVLLEGTWTFEGPERRPAFHLRTVYWLTPDGTLHERALNTLLAEPVPVEFHGQTFVVKSCRQYWRLP